MNLILSENKIKRVINKLMNINQKKTWWATIFKPRKNKGATWEVQQMQILILNF